jgi:hypothetical protein
MNRVNTCAITKDAKEKELNIIDTLLNNEYNINLGMRHHNQHKHNKNTDPKHQKSTGSLSHTVIKKQRKLQNSLKECKCK